MYNIILWNLVKITIEVSNKLVVDPSLINITDSKSEINIISNKVDLISDGSNNIAELNLVGKYQGDNNNLGNAKLHIGAFKDTGGPNLVGGGICFFTNIDETTFVNNAANDITNNFFVSIEVMEVIMKLVFLYQATSLGDNGVIFKKNIGIHTGNPSATLHIQGSKIMEEMRPAISIFLIIHIIQPLKVV